MADAVSGIAGATTLLDMATRVYYAYASVGEHIATWDSEESLKPLLQLVAVLQKVTGPAKETDPQQATCDLRQTLETALDRVTRLQPQRQASEQEGNRGFRAQQQHQQPHQHIQQQQQQQQQQEQQEQQQQQQQQQQHDGQEHGPQLSEQPRPLEPSDDAMTWFFNNCTHGRESAEWSVFWHKLKEEIFDPKKNHLGSRLHACYLLHKLYEEQQQRKFQEVISSIFPLDSTSSKLTRHQFGVIAAHKSLAEVIDWAMRVKWSGWVGPDKDASVPHLVEPVFLAGTQITGWVVGIIRLQPLPAALAWLLTGSRRSAVVVRLHAKCPGSPYELNGTGRIAVKPAHCATVFQTVQYKASGCTELRGQYAQPWPSQLWSRQPCRLIQFLDVPDQVYETGQHWEYTAQNFDAVQGEFVGYQVMRAWDGGPLASARFLFKQHDLQHPGLLDFVFISHTGRDRAAADFAAELHCQLTDKKIPAFLDTVSLQLGDVWRPLVVDAARTCRVFVAVVSPNYATRKWALLEMQLALQSAADLRCVVMPVLFDVSRKEIEHPSSILQDAWEQLKKEEKTQDFAKFKAAVDSAHMSLMQLLEFQTRSLPDGKGASVPLTCQVAEACQKRIRQWSGY